MIPFYVLVVCLPTGLGKTLIAAAVMYNFYRWFPKGKVVFMAPTKPLVKQQIQACHEVVGIPESVTAHLDGDVVQTKRRSLWKSHRVFYCTPHVLENDLKNQNCDPESIVCIIIDEAHRATGNYAYVKIVKQLSAYSSSFRVVALSATPGKSNREVQKVIDNLKISKIEVRSEEDSDVAMYTHMKQVESKSPVHCRSCAYPIYRLSFPIKPASYQM